VVHPTADETELLAELGMRPEECWGADAYWRYRDSVYVVQLVGRGQHSRETGIYYRFDTRYRQDDFDVFLPASTVTSEDFHHTFALLESLIDSGVIEAERARLKHGGGRWMARAERLAPFTELEAQR
jgi:hypothetical protein